MDACQFFDKQEQLDSVKSANRQHASIGPKGFIDVDLTGWLLWWFGVFLSTCLDCRDLRHISVMIYLQRESHAWICQPISSKDYWHATLRCTRNYFLPTEAFGKCFGWLILLFDFLFSELILSHKIIPSCLKKCRIIELFRNGFEGEADFLLQTG